MNSSDNASPALNSSKILNQNKTPEALEGEGNLRSFPNQENQIQGEENKRPHDSSLQETSGVSSKVEETNSNNSNLPEGFFDDPVQDAKVRLQNT